MSHRRDNRFETGHGTVPRRVTVMTVLSRIALLWERLWPAIWPAVATAGFFTVVALLDILPYLPGWLHAGILVAFAAGFIAALWRGTRALRVPSAAEARRRLETGSGVLHRPLTALDDSQATGSGDPEVQALWRFHRQRLAKQLARLRVGLPRAGLAAIDPLGLRAVLGLGLLIGFVIAGADWPRRLDRAFSPQVLGAQEATGIDIWINPPAYTGLPPLFLDPKTEIATPLAVPIGSTVLAQVQGGTTTPVLIVGGTKTAFDELAANAYKISVDIHDGDRLTIRRGLSELAAWPITVIPDTSPTAAFTAAPGRSERTALRIDYRATDDYGLAGLIAEIRRIDNPEAEAITLSLTLAGSNLKQVEGVSYHDLTPHPWAGLAVEIQLIARDAQNQTGKSNAVRTVLPERIFNHPVARALVELRKQLTMAPDDRFPIIHVLSRLYEQPAHFFHDVVVALAIQSAERRLIHDPSSAAIGQVQKLLWDTALHLEEGELAIAERDLRELQKALMEALAQGADESEIERLLDELQQALNNFLEALAAQLREQVEQGAEPQPLPPDTQFLRSEDLQQLIDRARELARSGARDVARELLSQLRDMLENLRANPFAQGMDADSQDAFRMMRDMENMLQSQQNLLDRSYRRWQQGAGKQDQALSQEQESQRRESAEDAEEQENLRRQLGSMMRQLGEALGDIPRPLGRAERAMREARDALESDQSGDAIDPQTRSLDELQQGMRAMAERFIEQMGNNAQRGSGQLGARQGFGTDPFGRRPGKTGTGAIEGVEIPSERELQRTREILDELRRRRGERRRPLQELDYIDRLLRQF